MTKKILPALDRGLCCESPLSIARECSTIERRDELSGRGHGWLRVGLVMGIVAAAVVGLYARVLAGWIKDLWNDPNYSHVYIVPIISAFVTWRRRHLLAALPVRGSWSGLALLLAGAAALIVGHIGTSQFLTRVSLIVLLAGLVLFHFGPAVLRNLTFPLGFLSFLVPMPLFFFFAMTAQLQNLAARSGAWALDLFGVAVLLDGNLIHLSNLTLGVTEACSGIRSLITLTALGVAWAHLMLPRRWMQVLLVLSVLPIVIAANAGRIVMTGLVGQSFGVDYAEGFFHFFAGWLIFIVAVLGLLAVHGLLRAASRLADWKTA